jgi:hypothetical protein
VSDFVSGSQLSLLFIAVCLMSLSAVALILSIQDEDIVFAWLWAVVFALSSLLVAWSFWRLV